MMADTFHSTNKGCIMAPPEKKNAFGVLMDASCKEWGTTNKKCCHQDHCGDRQARPKKCAFYVLMASARCPGAFDGALPGDYDSSLSRTDDDDDEDDKISIDGWQDSIERRDKPRAEMQDSTSKEKKWVHLDGLGEHHEGDDEERDPAVCEAMRRIDPIYTEAMFMDDNDVIGVRDDIQGWDAATLRLDSGTRAENVVVEPPCHMPMPPPVPSENTQLKEVEVFFDDSDRILGSNVTGFRFTYADGSEQEIGRCKLAKSKGPETLQDGEFITSVHCQHAQSTSTYMDEEQTPRNPPALNAILFYTNQGRDISFHNKTGWLTSFGYWPAHSNAVDRMDVPDGHALFSLQFCTRRQSIINLDTKPLSYFRKRKQVPSLTRMSIEAADEKVVCDEEGVDEWARKALEEEVESFNKRLEKLYALKRQSIRTSYPADRVRYHREQLARAEFNLKNYQTEILKTTHRAAARMVEESRNERIAIKNEVHRKRVLVSRTRMELADTCSKVGEEFIPTLLCVVSNCRKRFKPHLVPLRKRCSNEGCTTSVFPRCGCDVNPCQTCGKSFCYDHGRKHAQRCHKEMIRTCGWKHGADKINPMCCGETMEIGYCFKRCHRCLTQCCSRCRTSCEGRPGSRNRNNRGDRRDVSSIRDATHRTCGAVWCLGCYQDYYEFDRDIECCSDTRPAYPSDELSNTHSFQCI